MVPVTGRWYPMGAGRAGGGGQSRLPCTLPGDCYETVSTSREPTSALADSRLLRLRVRQDHISFQ